MTEKKKIVHYINQFFGGIGGEEKADFKPEARPGAVGPGLAFKKELGDAAEIVGTVICGDTYYAENLEKATKEILELIKSFNPAAVQARITDALVETHARLVAAGYEWGKDWEVVG